MVFSDVWDPWGRPIRYTINTTGLATGSSYQGGVGSAWPSGALTAYTLQSFGPDRTPGTADDIYKSYSVSDLQGLLSGALP